MSEVLKTLVSPTDSMLRQLAPVSAPCPSNDDILAFVQAALGADAIEEVHIHLDSCNKCQQLVSEAAHALDAAPISESARPSWNTVFQPSAVIAKRYRILRLVARGGMGEVYEAFDTALHERIALKTVTATNCDSEQAVRLLKAEVQLARRISHPNVCRIFDLGTHVMEPRGGEIHFLVMEFVEGECLGKKLRHSGPFEVATALAIARQLLQGLAAAHRAGIIHRDFKSDNVMLRSESEERVTPVILDFGLAKVLNDRGTLGPTQNQGQAMVGTIGYMAPEQVEGEPLSAASDIYAFGVVWFEMLTGRLPFEGETPAASAMARLHRPPLPPSRLNPKVPKWLDDIVLQCMGRHRRDRFASAEQVLETLAARTLEPEIPSAVPPRSRGAWVLASLLVLVGGVAANAVLHQHDAPIRTQIQRAVPTVPPPAEPAATAVSVPVSGVPISVEPAASNAPPAPRTATVVTVKKAPTVASRPAERSENPQPLVAPQPSVKLPPPTRQPTETEPKPKPEAKTEANTKEPDWLPMRTK